MADEPTLSPIRTGLACRCPRCGKGRLFQGFHNLRPRCEACGLDYGFADAGDGPAVFIILLAGFPMAFGALFVEVAFNPPIWLLLVIFLPLTLITCLLLLRPMKGLMLAAQFANRASEARRDGL